MRILTLFLAVTCFLAIAPSAGMAQQVNGCVRSELTDPARVVYTCQGGLVLEAEAAASFVIADTGAPGRPVAADLSGKGVLVEVEPGSGPFQILTPQAIAAVRGTVYAVDVEDGVTSVFVVRGEVGVSRPDGSEAVALGAGEGVTVTTGEPLVVKSWPQEKVDRLLARFAR
ncbi:FecR domain-containing protein [uncultured Roseibium sp.]|uniref:FecR domain-containing protein n=1 Tax=uncultured Roseibium sp. TaxID=1936171 RepID=UPI003217CE1E